MKKMGSEHDTPQKSIYRLSYSVSSAKSVDSSWSKRSHVACIGVASTDTSGVIRNGTVWILNSLAGIHAVFVALHNTHHAVWTVVALSVLCCFWHD